METALLVTRGVLVLVLAVAALNKARDRRGAANAARDLGVPEALAPTVGVALPIVEVATAVALVPASTARAGGAAALLLFAAFTAALGSKLVKGERPTCFCFGELSSEPISARTMWRNVALMALATLVAAAGPGAGFTSWAATGEETAGVALVVAIAVLCVVVVLLLGEIRGLRVRVDELEFYAPVRAPGIPVGKPVPDLEARLATGDRVDTAAMVADDRPTLLTFTDSGCQPCQLLYPDLINWSDDLAEHLQIVVVASGDEAANRQKASDTGLTVVVDRDRVIAKAFRIDGTPSAVIVESGAIATATASSPNGIRDLVSGHLSAKGILLTPPVGSPAPPFHVHDRDGHHLDDQSLVGQVTLLTFWSPTCGFCRQIEAEFAEELDRLVAAGGASLVISNAPADENAEIQLPGAVATDAEADVMRRYGVDGTPMAFMIDAEGRIASQVAAGTDDVLALARRVVQVASVSRAFEPGVVN